MKRLSFAATIVGLYVGNADADAIKYWTATRRVNVVDVWNIGTYGTIHKPAGIYIIVIRHGNKWQCCRPGRTAEAY
jgi:hypothetical protein